MASRILPALILALWAVAAGAGEVTIAMRTEGESGRFRFEPRLVWIEPGETVSFVADSHIHGTSTITGMIPTGARPWRSVMGRPLTVRLERPGVYGFKCPAHYALGMVGLIVVGDPRANLEAARRVRHPPAAQRAFARLFALIDCTLAGQGRCPAPRATVAYSGGFRKAHEGK